MSFPATHTLTIASRFGGRRVKVVAFGTGAAVAWALSKRKQIVECDTAPAWPYLSPAATMGFQPVYGNEEIGMAAAQCKVTAMSFGKSAGHISCRNDTSQRQRVRVPRGYMFQPEDAGMQTLIVEKDILLSLDPGQEAAADFDAYCGFSKKSVPKGPMRLSGVRAPSDVLGSQSSVWRWTRPFEAPPKQKTGGWFGRAAVAAAQEKRILSQSYGIAGEKYNALQAEMAKIDKDPKSHRTKPGDSALRNANARTPAASKPGVSARAPHAQPAGPSGTAPVARPAAHPVPPPPAPAPPAHPPATPAAAAGHATATPAAPPAASANVAHPHASAPCSKRK